MVRCSLLRWVSQGQIQQGQIQQILTSTSPQPSRREGDRLGAARAALGR